MAERQQHHRRYEVAGAGRPHYTTQTGPSGSQVLAVVTLLPVGGTLLALSGLALAGSVTALLVCTPLFLLFSPVIVPAAFVFGLAIAGFLTSGAFGLTGLSSLSYLVNCVRSFNFTETDQYSTGTGQYSTLDQVKNRMTDTADYVGEKTKDLGQGIQNKAHEAGGKNQNRARDTTVKT